DTKAWKKSFQNAKEGIKKLKEVLRQTKYDVSFDLQGNMKSGFIVSLVKAKDKVGFGLKAATERPNCLFNRIRFNPPKRCNVREENLYLVREYFKFFEEDISPYTLVELQIPASGKEMISKILSLAVLHERPKVMVCSGSIWQNKQITESSLKGFLKKLQEHLDCSFIFTWGSLKEKEYAESLKNSFKSSSLVLDKIPLPVLQNLMGKMDLVLAMDSLPLHLAGTVGVKTFSFFGPTSSEKFMPMDIMHGAFQGVCPYGRKFDRQCPILRSCKTGACLKDAQADALFSAFLSSQL
ncbi:MAG TPA: glycosyltransferase family 9 protein, partial [Parachlamydiaceae bacterium]|nr:glycosyltransferase family 9 protein [Parachlamydiaceae bacterium]